MEVRLDDGTTVPALAYAEVTGIPAVGELVLLSTAQFDSGLGTGGWALVAARPDAVREAAWEAALEAGSDVSAAAPGARARFGRGEVGRGEVGRDEIGRGEIGRGEIGKGEVGHLVKDRYSPLQQAVAGADEQGSPWHDQLADADDLHGCPVVVADLHSALPAVLAGIRERRPGTRVAYVMSDGGALPIAFSRTVAGLVEAGWLAATVTTGQAWGGDFEAVTVHSALLVARLAARADIVVLTQGPGNLGTGTRFGFSGVASGEAVNAAAVLNGRAVASLRISAADPRPRHRGISHHSLTAYGRIATAGADVVVPLLPGEFGERLLAQAAVLSPRHHLVEVGVGGLAQALAAVPVPLSSMGRSLAEDPPYFLAAAAAGRHAASLLAG